MEIPLYLAMTAAEFRNAQVLPVHTAWMACHFSSYGTGLSNIPKTLPPGSMLMLNDRTPVCGHDPQLVAQTLCDCAKDLDCARIALDFQRPCCEELFEVIKTLRTQAVCPVGISAPYAAEFDCPVLVPPIAPHVLPEDGIKPWAGRELWLEIASEGAQICVTERGSQTTPLLHFHPGNTGHWEPELHCHYEITVQEEQIIFQLGRTKEDQQTLINAAKSLGVTCALGLWQEREQISI